MAADPLDGILVFLRSAERLKTVTRSGWTSAGQRESVAEHTWRLCLMAMILYGRADGIDSASCCGCVSSMISARRSAATSRRPSSRRHRGAARRTRERADLLELIAPLPAEAQARDHRAVGRVRGGRVARGPGGEGSRQARDHPAAHPGHESGDFDYAFNLAYGQRYTAADPLLSALRERLDAETARRAAERDLLAADDGERRGRGAGASRAGRSRWCWRCTAGAACAHRTNIAGSTVSISRSTRPATWSSAWAANSSRCSAARCSSCWCRRPSSSRSGVRAIATGPRCRSGGWGRTAGTSRSTSRTRARRSCPSSAVASTTGRCCLGNWTGSIATRRSAARSFRGVLLYLVAVGGGAWLVLTVGPERGRSASALGRALASA